jgi:RNA polymerase sigma factor (sigma-70 family)
MAPPDTTQLLLAWSDGNEAALEKLSLSTLPEMDPRKSQIVELRFFGGLTVTETAEVMKISRRTVKREWSLAQAWLYCALRGEQQDDA